MEKMTWAYDMDPEIKKTGITVVILSGERESIQNFVEDVSHSIGSKLDWGYAGGNRALIKTLPQHVDQSAQFINGMTDQEIMSKYKVESVSGRFFTADYEVRGLPLKEWKHQDLVMEMTTLALIAHSSTTMEEKRSLLKDIEAMQQEIVRRMDLGVNK